MRRRNGGVRIEESLESEIWPACDYSGTAFHIGKVVGPDVLLALLGLVRRCRSRERGRPIVACKRHSP